MAKEKEYKQMIWHKYEPEFKEFVTISIGRKDMELTNWILYDTKPLQCPTEEEFNKTLNQLKNDTSVNHK